MTIYPLILLIEAFSLIAFLIVYTIAKPLSDIEDICMMGMLIVLFCAAATALCAVTHAYFLVL